MTFYILIQHERRKIRLKVEQIELTEMLEKFRVSGRNRSFVVQGNRPLFLSKGLKHRKPDWKVVEGGFENRQLLENITNAIMVKVSEK